ncbi:MAG TPA: MEDS domain-containing protein [Bryobacteraceae bacterium]|jgi:hypothetical protein|nr:MEDS domain-containing protein [Bryobacteraceae bacterium]
MDLVGDQSKISGESREERSHLIRLAGSALGSRAHICGFFSTPDDEHQILLPFIQEGLELGQKAVHTVDPRRREDHLQRLASAGIDVDALQANGQFELRDWNDTQFREERFNGPGTLALCDEIARSAKQKGFPLTRFITHMEWVFELQMDWDDLLEYEALANYIWMGREGPINPVICTYDLTRFTGDVVINVMRTHPLVIIGGILQENPFFVPPEEFLRQLRAKRTHVPGARHNPKKCFEWGRDGKRS